MFCFIKEYQQNCSNKRYLFIFWSKLTLTWSAYKNNIVWKDGNIVQSQPTNKGCLQNYFGILKQCPVLAKWYELSKWKLTLQFVAHQVLLTNVWCFFFHIWDRIPCFSLFLCHWLLFNLFQCNRAGITVYRLPGLDVL